MHDFLSSSQFIVVAFLLSLGLIAGAATYLDRGALRLRPNDEQLNAAQDASGPEPK